MSDVLIHIPAIPSKLFAKVFLYIPAAVFMAVLLKPRLLFMPLVTANMHIPVKALNVAVQQSIPAVTAPAQLEEKSDAITPVQVPPEISAPPLDSEQSTPPKHRGRKSSKLNSTGHSKKRHPRRASCFKMIHDLPYNVLLSIFGLKTQYMTVHPTRGECWNSYLARLEDSGNSEYKEVMVHLRTYFELLDYPMHRPAMQENSYSGTDLDKKLATVMFFENFGIYATGSDVDPFRQTIDAYLSKLSGMEAAGGGKAPKKGSKKVKPSQS